MDRVARLLGDSYGLAVGRLEPAPRGWTCETYTAIAQDGSRFFVKVYPKDRLPRTALAALPALAELLGLGLTQVSRPIRSMGGALHEWLGDDLVVVFEYLDAVPVPFTFGGHEVGELIARIHGQTERVSSAIPRETFEPPDADEVSCTLARARREPASDEPRRGLRRFLEEHGAAIADHWAVFDEIARACRAASFEPVLTHGDWPFNLLRGADNTVYLVDWDELLLAPAERDTSFAGDEPAFWRGYHARRGGHTRDELTTAYYVHHRYFEELLDFARVILSDGTPEQRARARALLDGDWMAGLRARMNSPLTQLDRQRAPRD